MICEVSIVKNLTIIVPPYKGFIVYRYILELLL